MTADQISKEFDIVYEAIASNDAPGYEAYEKSIILSRAQEQVVNDILEQGLEANEFNRLALSPYIKHASVTSTNISTSSYYDDAYMVDINSAQSITIDDIKHILSEIANDSIEVTPISYSFYNANKNNPYKQPDSDEFWRIIHEHSGSPELIIITDGSTLNSYVMDYIAQLEPIIVPGVAEDVVIDGHTVTSSEETNGYTCLLHSSLHRKIIEDAAKNADVYIGNQLGVQLRNIENN